MKQNDYGKTVRAMDVLFPKIGYHRGSTKTDYDKLMNWVNIGMDTKPIWWYIESRKFGTAPHSVLDWASNG